MEIHFLNTTFETTKRFNQYVFLPVQCKQIDEQTYDNHRKMWIFRKKRSTITMIT